MIVVRRLFAILLVPWLVLAFCFALVTGRVNATVLDAGFVKEQLRALDFYARVHDEAIPYVVEDYLAQQQERLPENLASVDLPTDPGSAQRMAALIQTFLPRDFLQAQVEQAIDEVLPWLAAKEGDFTLTLSLHDNLLATFGHPAPGRPSAFEQTWRDLDLGARVLTSLVEAWEAQRDPDSAPSEDAPTLPELLALDTPGAVAWLEANLFGAIDALLPFLVGESEHFDFRITFDAYPFLAYAFAGPLGTDPQTLAAEGWGFSDAELRAELERSDSEAWNNVDRTLAVFRTQGARITSGDLLRRLEAQQERTRLEDPEADTGLDPREMRTLMARGRIAAVWGPVGVAALLVAAIAFLGGRGWRGRLRWPPPSTAPPWVTGSTASWRSSGPNRKAASRPRSATPCSNASRR
jgi:hypothetical protein